MSMPGVDSTFPQQAEHPRLPLKWWPSGTTTTFTPHSSTVAAALVSCSSSASASASAADKLLTSSSTSNCCTRAGSSNIIIIIAKSTQEAVKSSSSSHRLGPSYRHNGQLRPPPPLSPPEATALARTPSSSPMGRISISLAPFHQRPLSQQQQQQPPIQSTATMSSPPPPTCHHLVFVDEQQRHCSSSAIALQTAQLIFSSHRLSVSSSISAALPLPAASSFSNCSGSSSAASAKTDDQAKRRRAEAASVCRRPPESSLMISTSDSVSSREEDGGPHSLSRLGQLFLLFDSFISSSSSSSPSFSSSSVTINCAISSATSTSSSSRQTTTSSFLQFIISLFLFFLYSPVLNIAEDAKSCKMLPKQNSSSRSEHLHRSSSSSLQHDQKGHQQKRSSDQRGRRSFFRAAALLCTLFLAMSSPSLSSASPPTSFQSSSSVVSSIPPPPSSYHHHQSSPLNLHRHHHPSHPHSYQNRAQQQQQQVNYPQEYNSGSFKSYNFHPHQFMQSEQPFGLQYNSQSAPKQSDRPVVADRTVRRISSAAESSNYFHNFPQHGLSIHNSGDPHSSSKQHYQPNSRIHTPTVSRQSSSTSKSTSPQPQPSSHFDPTKVCPEGPPSQWAKQLDVAGKAYLAPIVFTGQLVSLSEDFGGRIAATFRLLRLLKPTEVHGGGGNGQGSINHHSHHHHHQQHHNNSSSAVAALSALTNADYERHVKLFFFNRSTSAAGAASSSSLEPPYCAPFMADIKERLVTKQNYLLFAHEHVIATYRVRATSAPPSPSQTVTTTRHHQQQHHSSGNSHQQSSSRSHTPIELISLVTYADPEPLNRNTSRLVRKVLCKGCAKAAVVHSSASTFMVPVRGNISLACRMDGTPLPWIEWYRNGKRLRAREGKRVIIKRKRRVSHLTIIRASFRRDKGVYECRAMNVVSKEPAVKRFQVIVLRSESASTSGANRGFGADSKNNGRRKFRPMDGSGRVAGGQTAVSGGPPSSSSSHHYSSEGQQPYQQPSTPTSRRPVEPPDYYDSHETGQNPFSRKPIGFFHGQPCPIPDYCLNGGTCSLYETLGEYVCQCADGYRGQRCEFKDINKYPAHKALLDYDLSTRMLHSVMSQKVSEDDA